MSQANVIPTEDCPHILDDMVTTIREYEAALHRIATWGCRSLVGLPHEPKVEVFESGIYTVILAQDARAIAPALGRVSEAKPPPQAVALRRLRPMVSRLGHRPVLFNNNDAAQATPMLWWYEPAHPEELFAPTLDCHTGAVPDLGASVRLDHTLAVGSERMEQEDGMECWLEAIDQIQETRYRAQAREAIENDPYYKQITRVHYRDAMGLSVKRYLTPRVIGRTYDGYMPNGDFVCRTADVRMKKFAPREDEAARRLTGARSGPDDRIGWCLRGPASLSRSTASTCRNRPSHPGLTPRRRNQAIRMTDPADPAPLAAPSPSRPASSCS